MANSRWLSNRIHLFARRNLKAVVPNKRNIGLAGESQTRFRIVGEYDHEAAFKPRKDRIVVLGRGESASLLMNFGHGRPTKLQTVSPPR